MFRASLDCGSDRALFPHRARSCDFRAWAGRFLLGLAIALSWSGALVFGAGPVHEEVIGFEATPTNPTAGLTLGPDGYLWGETNAGGLGAGTIFKIKPDGTDRQTLYSLGTSGADDGLAPSVPLLYVAPESAGGDGFFWGTTAEGNGTLFKLNVRTLEFTTVVRFKGLTGNMLYTPLGPLVYQAPASAGAPGFVWGATGFGGANNFGAIYKVNTQTGALITVIDFTFDGANNKGARPLGLTVQPPATSGGTAFFWGITFASQGGTVLGTVFKIQVDTEALTTVATFSNSAATALTYEAPASAGGDVHFAWTSGSGIFEVNASTGAVRLVNDLTTAGSELGSTKSLLAFLPDGSGGRGTLWGAISATSNSGGVVENSTIFKDDIATGALTRIVDFTQFSPRFSKGLLGNAALLYQPDMSGGAGAFYGLISGGGTYNRGAIYKIDQLEATAPKVTILDEFAQTDLSQRGNSPNAGLVEAPSGGPGSPLALWGSTAGFGGVNFGTIFKIDEDSGELTTVVDFTGGTGANKGTAPTPGLAYVPPAKAGGDGFLWGTTARGGKITNLNSPLDPGAGTVFKVNARTGILTTVAEFEGPSTGIEGTTPNGELLYRPPGSGAGAGFLWGTTQVGMPGNNGTVFKVNPSTGELIRVAEFKDEPSKPSAPKVGARPTAGLTYVPAAGGRPAFFWGVTSGGGTGDNGTVFKVNASTGVLSSVALFTGKTGAVLGATPIGGLAFVPAAGKGGGGFLWGTTSAGGTFGNGTIFKLDVDSEALTTVVGFTGNGGDLAGIGPDSTLLYEPPQAGGMPGALFGTTERGAVHRSGTVFQLDPATGAFATVFEFTGTGAQAGSGSGGGSGALVRGSDGNLYGATLRGGTGGAGTIYRLRSGPTPVTLPATSVTANTARLQGTVNPNGVVTSVVFEWGTDPLLAKATVIDLGNTNTDTVPAALDAPLYGLVGATTYYFRVRASNGDNAQPQRGGILSFTTGADTSTEAPILTAPVTNAIIKSPVEIDYILPEAAAAGSLKLTFTGTTSVTLSLADSLGTAGPHHLAFSATDPTAGAAMVSGSLIANGTYSISLSYQDTHSHAAASSVPATGVILDATRPVLTLPQSQTLSTMNPAGAVAAFTVSAADNRDPHPVVSAVPPSGSLFPIGATTVRVTATDNAGNVTEGSFSVTVLQGVPFYNSVAAKNGPVFGAGVDPRIANQALYISFGIPAINEAGQVAYFAKWNAPSGGGSGIFVDGRLRVALREAVPGVQGAIWKLLKDPVLDEVGHIAFIGTIQGTEVNAGNDTVVATDGLSGNLAIVAREGAEAPGTGQAAWSRFTNVSLQGGFASPSGLLFTAALKAGTGVPKATSATALGAWSATANAPSLALALRGGQEVAGVAAGVTAVPGEQIKTFNLLAVPSASPGQGGQHLAGPFTVLTVTTSTGRQALCELDGGPQLLATTGSSPGSAGLTEALWQSFGPLRASLPPAATKLQGTVLASLQAGPGAITAAESRGVFFSSDDLVTFALVAQTDHPAPGFDAAAKFSGFTDPVIAADAAGVAFRGTAKGGPTTAGNDTAIWWKPAGKALELVAREGDRPPGAPMGAHWSSFTSVALPGGGVGPLFSAQLAGVKSATASGLYVLDTQHVLRELLRGGGTILGKSVKRFTVLKTVSGSMGSTRAFNNTGAVVLQVTYSTGEPAIVRIAIP